MQKETSKKGGRFFFKAIYISRWAGVEIVFFFIVVLSFARRGG